MSIDSKYMSIALKLAQRGLGLTSPNPPVGAVIVINDQIVGKGWHRKAGMAHAEIDAIDNAVKNGVRNFSNATMYVTLEPCCNYGKTPPCVDRLINEKFQRIVVATIDPNPSVCGKSISKLSSAGICVDVGILEDQARELIEFFTTYILSNHAFLAIKWAQSINGKISSDNSPSKYLSSETSLKFSHKLRSIYDAVIIGRKTLELDNPHLTTRFVKGRNPLRIVLGGKTKLDASYNVFTDNLAETILITTLKNPWKGKPPKNIEVWYAPHKKDRAISIKWVLTKLAQRGLTSALLEGGAYTITRAFAEDIVDKVYTIITPKIIGTGINVVSAEVMEKLVFVKFERMDTDILIVSKVKRK